MNAKDIIMHAASVGVALARALDINTIHPSPTNPRKTFPDADQAELIESVKRHGVMQPILVRPWPEAYAFDGEKPLYELIAGERRYRAAKAAGLAFIPATVRELDDHETLELQIVENLHRRDLNELEEAEGYELMTKQYDYTADQLAGKIGKSKAYIYARLKLTAATEPVRAAFRTGELDASRMLLISRIPGAALQQKALKELLTWPALGTYRSAADHIQGRYMLQLAKAPFPRADEGLVPAAGKCHPCPKRTGSNPELYPDVKSADICTDPDCYAAKKEAHHAREKQAAKDQGKKVIDGKAAEKLLQHGEWNIKGFIKLDDSCYDAKYDQEAKRHPTYRELLANTTIPTTLIEKSDNSLLEVVAEADFKAIAKDLGLKKEPSAGNEEHKKREAAAKEETDVRQRTHLAIRDAYLDRHQDLLGDEFTLGAADMALVARQYFAQLWDDNQKRLARMWVKTEEKTNDTERVKHLVEMIDNMDARDLCVFLLDLALIKTTHCGPWDNATTPAPLVDTATRYDIDVETIRFSVKAEKKAKESAKGGKGKKQAAAEPVTPATTPRPIDKATGEPFAYTHPDNAELCWSGRGKKPKWVENWLTEGGTLDELAPPKRCDKTIELPGLATPASQPAA